jgi:phenylacetate-CoA ligase
VVETRPGERLTVDMLAVLERKAEQLIKGYVGVTATVRVVEPGTIERSQGKAKRVHDLRPKA